MTAAAPAGDAANPHCSVARHLFSGGRGVDRSRAHDAGERSSGRSRWQRGKPGCGSSASRSRRLWPTTSRCRLIDSHVRHMDTDEPADQRRHSAHFRNIPLRSRDPSFDPREGIARRGVRPSRKHPPEKGLGPPRGAGCTGDGGFRQQAQQPFCSASGLPSRRPGSGGTAVARSDGRRGHGLGLGLVVGPTSRLSITPDRRPMMSPAAPAKSPRSAPHAPCRAPKQEHLQ